MTTARARTRVYGEITARRGGTFAALEALPEAVKGEIIDGVLYSQPRPGALHANAKAAIALGLYAPFQRGRRGPGGWWILMEPGVRAVSSPEFAPDVAGWRRQRLRHLPERIDVTPDWICEIVSPANRYYDVAIKKRFYARIGVRHLWYAHIDSQVLEVSRLQRGRWLEVSVHGGGERCRPEPFEAVELNMSEWWALPAPRARRPSRR